LISKVLVGLREESEIEIEARHGESRQNGSVNPDSEVIGNS
jgi:hypothetical protein